VKINLENGNQFIIEKTGDKSSNALIKEIYLNDKKYIKSYITHSDIINGGKLTFVMSKNNTISFEEDDLPNSKITDNIILPLPSIRDANRTFKDNTTITMEASEGSKIVYTINNGKEEEYKKAFPIFESTNIKMYAIKDSERSKTVEAKFYKIPKNRTITIKNKYQAQYSAGGNDALIDGLSGTNNFRTGAWQGYYYEDLEAVIDLGEPQMLTKIETNFIQDARSWIWMPEHVEYWESNDGKYYFPLGKEINNIDKLDYNVQIKMFSASFYPKKIKYIKIFAKNHNICPKGHLGEGGKGYIFADEIIFK
jgi:hypothetical protein